MGELKPIGSEKLQGNEKLKRILELTYYQNPTETKSRINAEFISESVNGVYGIVKEKNNYYVKKGLTENTLDYIGGMFMKHKNEFSSYAEAFKKLDLLKGQEELQEASKYVLKPKNPLPSEAAPAKPEIGNGGDGLPPSPDPDMGSFPPKSTPEDPASNDGDFDMGGEGEVDGVGGDQREKIQRYTGKV